MSTQAGFTLFELMIAIAVIAILTAIGLPAYQGYVQKAALTDMLQTMVPYKNSVEICLLETGSLESCRNGNQNVPNSKTSRYVSSVNVSNGLITLLGKGALQGLTTTLTPKRNSTDGALNWLRKCDITPANESLLKACQDVFRFDDEE